MHNSDDFLRLPFLFCIFSVFSTCCLARKEVCSFKEPRFVSCYALLRCVLRASFLYIRMQLARHYKALLSNPNSLYHYALAFHFHFHHRHSSKYYVMSSRSKGCQRQLQHRTLLRTIFVLYLCEELVPHKTTRMQMTQVLDSRCGMHNLASPCGVQVWQSHEQLPGFTFCSL